MFQLYANLLSVNVKYMWNKIIHKRKPLTPTQTSKAVLRKNTGDFCTIHSMNV
jgi:hypothetical protein